MNTSLPTHPASLRIFFTTEMWERYGFYVVQSLLALYTALRLHWNDTHVYELVGSFTAITYISPIIGGWIADHLLGQKRTIILGAIFLFFSYILLSLITETTSLIIALAGIAVGTGLLKPNISSLLGNEYPQESPQRESGFTIFYMGITTGIILGTTIPSFLNTYFDWYVSFASAAFGMIIALSVFIYGIKRYAISDYYPVNFQWKNCLKAIILISVIWLISFCILLYSRLADLSFSLVTLGALAYLIYTIYSEPEIQSRQTVVIGILCMISIVFWAFYFQMFLSLTLFLSRVVEPTLWSFSFPPPYYVGIQSVGMLIFGYFLSRTSSSTALLSRHRGIATGNKFLLALFFVMITYGLITLLCHITNDAKLPPWLFIPIFLLFSIAELLLSPVGLAAITCLASRKKVSTMMGIFFVSLGLGGFLSGKLALITAISPDTLSLSDLKIHYAYTFKILLIILSAATCICFLLNCYIKKLLKDA